MDDSTTLEALTLASIPSYHVTDGGYLIEGEQINIPLPSLPVRYLYSGWQSWSLTAWVPTKRRLLPPRPATMHPLQTDPLYARETRPHGSWYGAVELANGQIILLGALDLESHVRLDGSRLTGWYEQGRGKWFLAFGDENEILAHYANLLGKRFGKSRGLNPPRVWCSWYSLYTEIHEAQLLKILKDLDDLPFDVFQIDDGWQVKIGDWEANEKFPNGMAAMASKIHQTGRRAGLWLAPLLVVPSSTLYRQHPDWILRDEKHRPVSAGFNWEEALYALDVTHPAVQEWLAALIKKICAWGYDYLKLDFLYAGALPGKRHIPMPREAAYRQGLQIIREAAGEAYILTCGAPILPSLGLCDGLRVGPDVAGHWTSYRDDMLMMNFAIPSSRNALRTTVHRLWLRPLVHTDPDVVYFRSRQNHLSEEQKALLRDLAHIAGFKATSDIPSWLTEAERQALREFLEHQPQIQPIGRYLYLLDNRLVDFAPHIALPPSPSIRMNLQGALLAWLASCPPIFRLFSALTNKAIQKTIHDNPV